MKRGDIQKMLEDFQNELGEKPYVYFQPPETVKLTYPCFVYSYSDVVIRYANDSPYLKSEEYIVKYITKKADPPMLDSLLKLQSLRFDRHFIADNLHHYSFVLSTPLKSITPMVDLTEIEKRYL